MASPMQQQPIPVPATMPLTVTLEAQQWQQVIGALSEAPYRIAAPLIEAITQQFQAQAASAQQQTETPGMLPTGNGLDTNPPPITPPTSN